MDKKNETILNLISEKTCRQNELINELRVAQTHIYIYIYIYMGRV